MTNLSERTSRQPSWHALPADSAISDLDTARTGLSQAEAKQRLATHGPNRLPEAKRRGPLMMFLAQFHNVLIYVLIAAGIGTLLLGEYVDSAVIFGVVVINAIIGFIQEGKAEKALDAIRHMLTPSAIVLRDGHKVEIDAQELVPGDVVLLQSGDKVPADLRLVHVKGLRVQEAVLTGESLPVDKACDPVADDAPLGDRRSMAYSGTLVAAGQAAGIVVATGGDTEIGRISTMLSEVTQLTTPLLRKMAVFGRQLTVAILVLAVFTFAYGYLVHGFSVNEMFLAAVGLAVAAIPEGLPAIMTISLAIGVQRMARRNAIIRRLPAVETLGSVTVICSDKTGTLTRNEMTVRSVMTPEASCRIEGVGYEPSGAFCVDGHRINVQERSDLVDFCRAALLCNDADLLEQEGHWIVTGDPMEGALIALAAKAGLDAQTERGRHPRVDTIPFESEHRFMASLHHDHHGHAFVIVKGAPERVLEMCSHQRHDGDDRPLDLRRWHAAIEEIAGHGERVLALAIKPVPLEKRELTFGEVEGGLTLLGLLGLIDPPREEAITSVRRCRQAGIAVKMITGDHAATAQAIGRQLGLTHPSVVTGNDIDRLDDVALQPVARDADVFARTSPEHKLRLVTALQAGGAVTAMTGDGVNDAPALKRSDVGVAMGRKGTEAAKEAAEMVLADDNFASIAHAVEEGRTVFDNLRKSILFILPTNGGQAMVMIAAVVLGIVLPITAKQILWVNMITAVTLALALAFEAAEADIMRRPPRRPSEGILSPFLMWRVAFVSLLLLIIVMVLFEYERAAGSSVETARTVAVNALVVGEVFYLLSVRSFYQPALSRQVLQGVRPSLIAIGLVIVWQALFTYAGPFQMLFDTEALDLAAWSRILMAGLALFVVVELEKVVINYRYHRRNTEGDGA